MADSATINDKTPPAKAGSDAHQPPVVTAKDHADFHAAVAASAAPKPDVVKGGQIDLTGDVYGRQAGDPQSVAKVADGTVKAGDRSTLGAPLAGADNAPRAGTDKTPQLGADGRPIPGADRAPEGRSGADVARDVPAAPGEAPLTKSNEITYRANETQERELQDSKAKLVAAEGSMSPELKASMAKHMDNLEHRLPAATPEQIKGVYDATTRLLTDPEKTSQLSQAERNRLGNDILSNAAQQHEIDQGMHNTCNVTTVEQTLNRESPDKAAALVADVALKSEYQKYKTGPDGHPIKDGAPVHINLDPKSLHPDGETNFGGTKASNGDRNYASQVFDMATINEHWQKQSTPGIYTQTNARDGQGDTGERLMYANGREMRGPDGKPIRSPNLGSEAIAQIGKDVGLSGNFMVTTKEFHGGDADGVKGENRVQSYDEFREALKTNSTTIIGLNAKDKLFTGTENKGGAQGGHVVTVSDYKSGPPEQVYMRNQWGAENNKWVSVADLYNASLPPESQSRVTPEGVQNVPSGDRSGPDGGHDRRTGGGGREGRHEGGSGGGGGRDGDGDAPVNPRTAKVQHDDHLMTDEEYKKWKEQIKKEEPDDLAKQREKAAADRQGVIADLKAKLADAKDDYTKWIYQAQISMLDAQ